MKNAAQWTPTKYVFHRGTLRGSRDTRHLGAGSRLAADLFAARYQDALPRHARGRLLDLGCGHVPLYAAYHDGVDEVVTLDWAQSRHSALHVDVAHDLNAPLPFPDRRFDCVVVSDVLEHIARPDRLCEEMNRVLTPGGRVVGSVPFYYPIHEQPHDFFRYTRFGLQQLLEAAGMRIDLLVPVGGSVDVFADLAAKHLAAGGPAGRLIAAALQNVAVLFGGTRLGTAIRARSGERFPLGYFFVAVRPV
jgi:SAM-dependent methyltransferase